MDFESENLQDKPHKGGWVEMCTLGSGGFGQVNLWVHKDTRQAIALKKCRVQSEMTPKHKQRWQMEVNIMLRLSNPNVVHSIPVPPPLDVGKDEIPLLAMEYCSLGDLRKMLNQPANCCGLQEFQVRAIAHDITAGVEYLHSKRVIHRDLKPENIVLQNVDNMTVYKLIDLGYAKDLDQGSVCTSFVGTLQYLAPELFEKGQYNGTVDYWSLGTLLFECITGVRPFLPTLAPVQWHGKVMGKEADDIYAFLNAQNEVQYSKNIPSPNHLCRTTKIFFENFLRMMLRWDPRERGGGVGDSKRPKCFQVMDDILNCEIVYVLNVAANQLLSYHIPDDHTMQDLMKLIEIETHIPVADQDLLMATGVPPNLDGKASQCWKPPNEEEEWILFVFSKQPNYNLKQRRDKGPTETVQQMIRNPMERMTYQDKKKAWAEAVYYCMDHSRDYRRLLQAQRQLCKSALAIYRLSRLMLLRNNSNFTKMRTRLMTDVSKLMAKMDFFRVSHQMDLGKYQEQASAGITSQAMLKSWVKMSEEVEKFTVLQEECTQVEQQCAYFQSRLLELQRSPFSKARQTNSLDPIEKGALELYQDFRQMAKEQRNTNTGGSQAMVQFVVRCNSMWDSMTKELYTHLGKLPMCKAELTALFPKVEQLLMSIQMADSKLTAYQKQRQSDLWNLLSVALRKTPTNGPQVSRSNSKVSMESTGSGGDRSMAASVMERYNEESLLVLNENQSIRDQLHGMVSSLQLDQVQSLSTQFDWSFLHVDELKSASAS